MFINTQLVKVLKLLGLEYYEEDKKLIIVDTKSKESTYVTYDDNGKGSFTINGMEISFLDREIELKVDNSVLTIEGKNVLYSRKSKSNSKINSVSFRIYNNSISFYSNEDDISSSVKLYYKDDFEYKKMTSSISLKTNDGTIIEEKVNSEKEGNTIERITTRLYDKEGKIVSSNPENKNHNILIDKFIRDMIEPKSIFSDVIVELDDMLPGIVEYYGRLNPNIKDISDRINRQYHE